MLQKNKNKQNKTKPKTKLVAVQQLKHSSGPGRHPQGANRSLLKGIKNIKIKSTENMLKSRSQGPSSSLILI